MSDQFKQVEQVWRDPINSFDFLEGNELTEGEHVQIVWPDGHISRKIIHVDDVPSEGGRRDHRAFVKQTIHGTVDRIYLRWKVDGTMVRRFDQFSATNPFDVTEAFQEDDD